jgi:cobalt/nickel transport protein
MRHDLMKTFSFVFFFVILLTAPNSQAHFQVIMPSTDIVTAEADKTVELDVMFTHPMDWGPIMNMAAPVQFGVFFQGKKYDLKSSLKEKKIEGKTTYAASYTIKKPGDYVFYIEPGAYWEPSEQIMIVHYTKVVVNGLGEEQGWDQMVGFPVEIEPLVRPYGLWSGNVFRGVVKKQGKPVPGAEIEVEYYNQGASIKPPSSPFVTQVIKADEKGVFSYAMPKAGWWGFAALIEGDEKMKSPEGTMVPVELGGLIWVKTVDMK